jgi:hypothetical protein
LRNHRHKGCLKTRVLMKSPDKLKTMKKLCVTVTASLAVLILLSGCLSLRFGCGSTSEVDVPATGQQGSEFVRAEAAGDSLADLQVRLSAAKHILSFVERDRALAGIARDAAAVEAVDVAKRALSEMTSFTERDTATVVVARVLNRLGRRAEALDVAGTITSFSKRDAVLQELAH